MRRAARTDANQADIAQALIRIGCSVAVTSGAGDGFPDLVVGFKNRNFLLEVKDGDKPKSKQALTTDQIKFHGNWRGQLEVVTSVDEAIAVCTGSGDTVL